MPRMLTMLRFLLGRAFGRRRTTPGLATRPRHVVMYSRQGCHLCDDVWKQLQKARRQYPFTLEKTDVDADAELKAKFGEQVPVVCVDGKVRFRGQVNNVLLQRLLEAE